MIDNYNNYITEYGEEIDSLYENIPGVSYDKAYPERQLSEAFDEFKSDLLNHSTKEFISFGIAKEAFNEGGSEIYMENYGYPETVNEPESFSRLLNTLGVTQKDFYDFLIHKGIEKEDIVSKDYMLNPDAWHDCFTQSSDLDSVEKFERLEGLYSAMEEQVSLMFEPVVVNYMLYTDYIELDMERPVQFDKGYIALHDFHSGSGYIFDTPVNDLTIDYSEDSPGMAKIDGEYGYGINETYGLVTSYFESEVKNTDKTIPVSNNQFELSL